MALSIREIADLKEFVEMTCELPAAAHLMSDAGDCPGCGVEYHHTDAAHGPEGAICLDCGQPSDLLMGSLFAGGFEIF